eukprot:m.196703 g.196703  ORF g.196703 m.196703 type:complete len:127 (+) comp15702_c0_seq8:96-476(+)
MSSFFKPLSRLHRQIFRTKKPPKLRKIPHTLSHHGKYGDQVTRYENCHVTGTTWHDDFKYLETMSQEDITRYLESEERYTDWVLRDTRKFQNSLLEEFRSIQVEQNHSNVHFSITFSVSFLVTCLT